MGWIVDFLIEWIWVDLVAATYRRYGLVAAALVVFAPFALIGLLIALLVAA